MKGVLFILAALMTVVFPRPCQSVAGEDAESRAWQIRLPLFELHEATIDESIRALAAKSRDLDPERQGVNFVWPSKLPAEVRLNLRLANVPLREAARYVARLAGMRLATAPHALVFITADVAPGPPMAPRFSLAARLAGELIVPQVEFREATLPAALVYLERLGREADPKRAGINIVVDVPPETRDTRITLSLAKVPIGEALRYAADLAGMVVVEEPYALIVTAPERPPVPPEMPVQIEQLPAPPSLLQRWRNPLLKRPEAVSPGSAFRNNDSASGGAPMTALWQSLSHRQRFVALALFARAATWTCATCILAGSGTGLAARCCSPWSPKPGSGDSQRCD